MSCRLLPPNNKGLYHGQVSYDCAAEKRSRRLARNSAARGCASIMQRVGGRQRFLCRGRNTDAGRWPNRCSVSTAQLPAANKVGRLQANLQENLQTAIAPASHVAGCLWRSAADTRSACGRIGSLVGWMSIHYGYRRHQRSGRQSCGRQTARRRLPSDQARYLNPWAAPFCCHWVASLTLPLIAADHWRGGGGKRQATCGHVWPAGSNGNKPNV
jgi:hypothetical protein